MNIDFLKRKTKFKGTTKDILYPVLTLYVLLHVVIFVNQRALLYKTVTTHVSPVAAGAPDMQSITVTPVDMHESIEGWYKAPADPTKPVIVYFHGNATSIGMRGVIAEYFIKQGYGVLLAEYRGFSGNPGSPSEVGLYADGEAYIDWLIKEEHIPENKIVLYGESMGSAVSVFLAARHLNVSGMILDGSFSSMTAVLQKTWRFIIVPLVFSDHFDNLMRIRRVTCPILFLHGQKDPVVPIRLATLLYNTANNPKVMKIFPEGKHTDLYNYGAGEYVDAFLKSLK